MTSKFELTPQQAGAYLRDTYSAGNMTKVMCPLPGGSSDVGPLIGIFEGDTLLGTLQAPDGWVFILHEPKEEKEGTVQ